MVQHLNNIGTNFRRLGILEEASAYHYRALTLCEHYSDTVSRVSRKNRVISLNGIGNVQLTLGNTEAAAGAFRAALAGERLLGSDLGQAINYANLGAIFEDLGQRDSAMAYYQKSLECNKRAESDLGIALCYGHFGHLAQEAGHWDEALEHYSNAYALLENNADRWHWLESCISIARVSLLKGDWAKVRTYISRARNVAEEISSIEHLAIICDIEYQYFEALGNPRRALDSYVASRAYSDSLATVKTANHMQNVRVRYESERRQQELDFAQSSYLAERKAHDSAILAFIALAVVAALVIAFLVIVNRGRASRQKMMKRMETMRSNFFTNITHEFRTPLTVIIGLSKDIEEGRIQDGDQLAQAAEVIGRQGKGLLELVNQLLDISRIKSEIGSPQWRRGDMAGFVSMIAEVYSRSAASKGIELKFRCESKEIQMDFVPDYLKKIVCNLLSNAAKFTPEGGHIFIEVDDRGETVVLRVCDDGCGIDSDDLPHIFEPFYMGRNASTETSTGVGLSLVSQLVEAMDGTIAVQSEKGRGTTFTVTLPAVHKGVADIPNPDLEQASVEGIGLLSAEDVTVDGREDFRENADEGLADRINDDGRQIVLIVEDNHDIAWYIGSHLDDKYSLLFASNGEEGLEKAIQHVPDVIVTDCLMPVMDGLKLCAAVRSNELLSHIPVIMVTAKVDEEDRLKGLDTGADAYLTKPFNCEELELRIGKLLEQRQLLREKYLRMISSAALPLGGEAVEGVPMGVLDGGAGATGQNQIDGLGLACANNDYVCKVVDFIRGSLEKGEKVDVNTCASHMCVCTRQFSRKLGAMTGETPTAFINGIKVARAKQLLCTRPDMSISQIALESGFENTSYFSKIFRLTTGLTPSDFRNAAGH